MKTLLLRSADFLCRHFFPLLLLLSSASVFGQSDPQSVNDLLSQRSALIYSGESTSSVDNQLHALGHNPRAILNSETLAGGHIQVSCPLYLDFTAQNVSGMFPRLSAAYPFLLSLERNSSENLLTGIFQAGTTNDQIAEVFNHFGYKGYETQH